MNFANWDYFQPKNSTFYKVFHFKKHIVRFIFTTHFLKDAILEAQQFHDGFRVQQFFIQGSPTCFVLQALFAGSPAPAPGLPTGG